MTTDYIETRSKDGAMIRIEVEPGAKTKTGFGTQTASGDTEKEATANAYEETLSTIRTCANGMIDTLQGLEAVPSAASIEFALKVDAKAGVMIAKSAGNAQFKVSLSWKQPEPEKTEGKS